MSALNLVDSEQTVAKPSTEATESTHKDVQTYTTVLGTVRDGQIILPQNIDVPENTTVLITILEDKSKQLPPADYENYTEEELENMTVGEQIIAGLKDIVAGRTTRVESAEDLERFLDSIDED